VTASAPLVVVTSSFPIRGDGSEAAGSFVADTVAELARHVPVRVVAPGASEAHEIWSERIVVQRYSAPEQPLSTLKPWRPADLRWILRVLASGARVTRRAAEGARSIVALWGLPCGEWARRAAASEHIGYSVWMLGSDVWSLGRMPILRGMLRRVIRDAQHAYADGYALADEAAHIGGVPIAFLPSTRRIECAAPSQRRTHAPYRLLFLGRWHPNKGVDLLLDALDLLSDADFARIESVAIEGGGPLEPLVRERVARLRARGRPVAAGRFLDKAAAEAAIDTADWLLIPSRLESIPVVFSDAMKMRRPVVATPVGDLPRLMHGLRCGVIAERIDAASYAQALSTALADASTDDADLARVAAPFSLDAIAARLLGDDHES
jgi:glycosyltransferase involved in cell wall biosynthesis